MHTKPIDFSERRWKTAQRIINFIGTVDGVFVYNVKRELSIRDIAEGVPLDISLLKQHYMRDLVALRIVGRQMQRAGFYKAYTWIYPPEQQIQHAIQKRTPRVAAVEPVIRQALREDRESLRAVAKRFGVCADTVQDIRKVVAPYDPGTAQTWRCPKCGALITSPSCLRCSLI